MAPKLLLCVLVAILHQDVLGQGGRGGPGGNNNPGGGRSDGDDRRSQRPVNPNACQVDELSDVSDEAKALFQGVLDGDKQPSELLPYLVEFPNICLRLIAPKFADKNGTCDQADVKDLLCEDCMSTDCEGGRGMELLKTVYPCLNQSKQCEFLQTMVADNPDCLAERVNRYLSEELVTMSCSGELPACSVFSLPLEDLEAYLRNLDADGLFNLLVNSDPGIAKKLSCEKIQAIVGIVQEKDLLDFTSQGFDSRLLPLMPYLPEDICRLIPYDMLEPLIESLSMLDFMCRRGDDDDDDDDDYDDDSDDNDDDADDDDESDEMSEMKSGMRQGKCKLQRRGPPPNTRNSECQFGCGRAIIETLGQNLNFSNSTARDRLGMLAKCLPVEDLLRSVLPGQCEDIGPDEMPRGRGARRQLAKKCRTETALENCTSSCVDGMGCTTTEIGESALETIPKAAFCDSALNGTLSECVRNQRGKPEDFERYVARRCGGELNADTVRKLGGTAVKAPCDAWDSMTPADRAGVAKEMREGLEEMMENGQRGRKGKAGCMNVADLPTDELIQSPALTETLSQKSMMRKKKKVPTATLR